MRSELEEELAYQLRITKLPIPIREFQFAELRRWRFDFAWPDLKLAVEVEGGSWIGGRHARGAGFRLDCEKYNEAQLRGWKLLRFTGEMVSDGSALNLIEWVLKGASK